MGSPFAQDCHAFVTEFAVAARRTERPGCGLLAEEGHIFDTGAAVPGRACCPGVVLAEGCARFAGGHSAQTSDRVLVPAMPSVPRIDCSRKEPCTIGLMADTSTSAI